jgi:hypothetical protein
MSYDEEEVIGSDEGDSFDMENEEVPGGMAEIGDDFGLDEEDPDKDS